MNVESKPKMSPTAVLVFLLISVVGADEEVKYYEELINNNVASALAYEFETDARQYEAADQEVKGNTRNVNTCFRKVAVEFSII